MAQNYRDGEGRKVDTFCQERSDRKLSGANYTTEAFQDRKDSLQEQVRKADTVPTKERNTDYPGTESEVLSGMENPGGRVEKLASDTRPKVYVENRSAECGGDAGKDVRVGARAKENLEQQSRYVQHDSKVDNNERGYGAEVLEPKQAQGPPLAANEQKSEPMHEGKKEKLPSHEPHAVEVDQHHEKKPQADEAPKSPGFVEKIKEMFTGKPQNEDSNMAAGEGCEPQHEAAESKVADGEAGHGDDKPKSEPPKKGVLDKIKEKLSPSP